LLLIETEDLAIERGARAGFSPLRGRLQGDDRVVQQLLDHRARQVVNDGLLLGGERREATGVALDLFVADVVKMLAERGDRRGEIDRLAPAIEDDDLDVEHPTRL